jgi:hypothetical protein
VEGVLFQPFTNFSTLLSEKFSVDLGVRYLHFTYSKGSDAIEPRILMNYQVNTSSLFSASYGLVSQQQLPHIYVASGNNNLSLSKAHHAEVSYRKKWDQGLTISPVVFYQRLFDVPVEADPSSTFSVLNLLDGLAPGNLINAGTGENYGITLTAEKSFFENHYFLLGGSYYQSTYKTNGDETYSTRFDGKYTFNAVYGREWARPEKNRVIGLNTRLLYLGGLRTSPVHETDSEANNVTVYDESRPFEEKLGDYFRIDLRVSFRKNNPGYTRTFAIDIQNLLSQENEAYPYYDFVQQKAVTKLQLGIIPVLVYRIDF